MKFTELIEYHRLTQHTKGLYPFVALLLLVAMSYILPLKLGDI